MLKYLSLTFLFVFSINAQVHHPELPSELIGVPYVDRYFRTIKLEDAHAVFGHPKLDKIDSKKINVLVWNIQKSKQVAWNEEFFKFSKSQDLILLQEAYDDENFRNSIAPLSDFRWDFAQSFEYLLYNIMTGNMVGSNTLPTKSVVLHSTDHEPILKTPKSTMINYYSMTDSIHNLLVISIHGINFTTNQAFYRQMRQIFPIIDTHTGPIIFAGDFNTHNSFRTKFVIQELEKRGLTLVNFVNKHLIKKFNGNTLDHTFIRNLSITSAMVPKNTHGSDHAPMILKLKVKHQELAKQ